MNSMLKQASFISFRLPHIYYLTALCVRNPGPASLAFVLQRLPGCDAVGQCWALCKGLLGRV